MIFALPTRPHTLRCCGPWRRTLSRHGHDLKRLIRLIVQSRSYQLSSTPNQSNREDTINYSRSLPRPLDAEVLLDAISQVTGIEEEFQTRAINLPVLSEGQGHQFLKVHSKPDRQTVPEREVKPNLSQALHQLAGTTYTEKLSGEGGRLDRLLGSGASDERIIEELYLAALTRFPSEEERSGLTAAIGGRASRREAFEDLLWGIVNSNEFAYNH